MIPTLWATIVVCALVGGCVLVMGAGWAIERRREHQARHGLRRR